MAETTNNTEKTYDVGQDTTELGFAYLFFRYVWPVFVFILVAIAAFFFGRWFLTQVTYHPINFQVQNLPQAPAIKTS